MGVAGACAIANHWIAGGLVRGGNTQGIGNTAGGAGTYRLHSVAVFCLAHNSGIGVAVSGNRGGV